MDGPLLKEFIAKASKCGAFKNWKNEAVSHDVCRVLFAATTELCGSRQVKTNVSSAQSELL